MSPNPAISTLDRARSDLASSILRAGLNRYDADRLAVGQIPEELERKVLAFAAARAAAGRWQGGGGAIELWREAWEAYQAREGRPPSIAALAKERGKSKTAAHRAIRTLRALGRIPDPAE